MEGRQFLQSTAAGRFRAAAAEVDARFDHPMLAATVSQEKETTAALERGIERGARRRRDHTSRWTAGNSP